MFNLRLSSIKEKLAAIEFTSLARSTGCDNVYSKKISTFSFLFGFMKMYSHRMHSLAHWAACIGQVSGEVVSKQAVDQKFTLRHKQCFKEVMESLLGCQYDSIKHDRSVWKDFDRVLIQDSTCWSVPGSLVDHFPGPRSNKGIKKATARLQVCYDVKEERFHECDVQSFCDNDQKHASAITAWVRPGDLLIRDLGYFSQHVFAHLEQAGVFFVSRLHYRITLYIGSKRLSLNTLTQGKERIDMSVLLGLKKKVPVRLIGVKLPAAQAAERRRKAKKKDSRSTPGKAYLQWVGWSFYITNLPARHYSVEQICQFYRLRWRIEILFKGFKSGLNWSWMFNHRTLTYNRVMITIYMMLIYVLLCWQCYRWFVTRCSSLSLLKFLSWYRLHYDELMQSGDLAPYVCFVTQQCRYEKRKTRDNYHQLAMINV